MTFILHAPNVHQGGGKTLLADLLNHLGSQAVLLILDKRFPKGDLKADLNVIDVSPTMIGRIHAEVRLYKMARAADQLLCFGNLPPLFQNPAHVTVFLQNRYLFGKHKFRSFSWKARIRLHMERLWFRFRMKPEYRIIVQSETMQRELNRALGFNSEVLPFLPRCETAAAFPQALVSMNNLYEFIYVSSGEPHKNHHNLIEAWKLLAMQGHRPQLLITLDPSSSSALVKQIDRAVLDHGLAIKNLGAVPPTQVRSFYLQSKALIFPSRLESFGLPLLEAKQLGLPILAPELDYVRDVVEPVQSFDPDSPISIARAVMRHMNLQATQVEPVDAVTFLARIQQQATA